jgi:Ca2+-binding EF-hand superfamily protein
VKHSQLGLLPVFSMILLAASSVQAAVPVITEGDIVSVVMSEDGTPTAFALTLNGTDADMDALSWTVASPASSGVATVEGADTSAVVNYVPNANVNGSDSFGVQVDDGNGGTDLVLVNVTIEALNDPPVIAPIGDQTVSEGETLLFAVVATDPDDETATLSGENIPAGADFDADLGVFTWTPDFDDAGLYSGIVFTAVDGGDPLVMATETIDVTVTDSNRPPVLDTVGNGEVREENTFTLALTGSDPDGDDFTFFMNMLPSGATFDAMTATLTYTPALGEAGDYAVVAGIQDDGTPQQSDTEAFVITVTPLDPSAVFEADAETLLANFATGDADTDGLLSLAEALTLVPGLLESRFDGMDDNSDGQLSEAELLPFATISDEALESAAQSLLNAFAGADMDEDGLLSTDEAGAIVAGLTADQFAALDEDEDGFLSEEEVSDVATARAIGMEALAEELLPQFGDADTDSDGALSRAEVLALLPDFTYEDFVGLNLDRNEVLTETELNTVATAGDADLESAAELISEFFFDADVDGDGFVSREEAQRGISTLTLRDFQEMDTDGDGLLSESEVDAAAIVGDAELETAAEALSDGFAGADSDDDGTLSRTEAETILPELTLEQFQSLDTDGDESLSEAEVTAAATLDDPVPAAPAIAEGVTVGGITESSALVSWKTQVLSTATVFFGTTQTALDSSVDSGTATGTHQVLLEELEANTTYFVRVDLEYPGDETLTGSSRIISFRTVNSADTEVPEFITLPAVVGASDMSIHLAWSTNETTFGEVLVNDTTFDTPTAAKSHGLTLENLAPGTAHDLLVTARDASGNLSSVALTANTLAQADRAPARIVDGVLVTRLADTSVSLRWATDKPATTVVVFSDDGGAELSQSLPGLRREHFLTLAGLSPETTYSITAESEDWLGNGTARAALDPTQTLATSSDAAPIFVAIPRVIGLTDSAAIVYWETDRQSDSTVEFWQSGQSVKSESSSAPVLGHQVELRGLQAGTTYRFACTSTTLSGVSATTDKEAGPGDESGEALVFTTEDTPDTQAPTIVDGPEVVGITDEGFTVRWTTDEPADSFVRYGPAGGVERQEFQRNVPRTEHLVTIRGLRSETEYEVAVSTADTSGNGPVSAAPLTTTTSDAIDSTGPVLTVAPVIETVSSKFAELRWETDELASADVTLSVSPTEIHSIQAVPALGTSQSLVLTNLSTGTTYGYTLRALDQNGNATSAAGQFTTAAAALTVSPSRIFINQGDTVQLEVTSEDPEETDFQFVSENAAIASVNSTGLVTGVNVGQVDVLVADESGQRGVIVPVNILAVPETEDLTGFFTLLGIFLLQNGESGTIGPCFIATAASDTPLAPEIDTLRRFRDDYLLTNGAGTMFVDAYYRVSPPLADWIAGHPVAALLVRILMVPVLILTALWMQSPILTVTLLVLTGLCFRRVRRRGATA